MASAPWLSIIIPTFNEAGHIGPLLWALRRLGAAAPAVELIVADGGSTDATAAEAAAAGAQLVHSPRKGRAAQLNYGAARARGALLYFLHADSYPPATLLTDLRRACAASGCYRLAFDDPHWFLQLSAWCTRFDWDALRFGDQSLFVRREVWAAVGGYNERLIVFEDQEIIGRLRRQGRFVVLPGAVITSARKYRANGVYRLQLTFGLLCLLYRLGVAQATLVRLYRRLIRQGKI
ncbi:TIGR04283 family arsenosugar biosynthesis glycosyltransferase [uncultured Hymenobacter sp.]|uniref:TIGR04283 family arsenosugar biosynthesis glycosyltransferase n=1 Tax=uncultured Hymenobacter sp. TaxID=170016 RepID=UPI0035CC8A62